MGCRQDGGRCIAPGTGFQRCKPDLHLLNLEISALSLLRLRAGRSGVRNAKASAGTAAPRRAPQCATTPADERRPPATSG